MSSETIMVAGHQRRKEAVRHEGDTETGRGDCPHKNCQPEAVPFQRSRQHEFCNQSEEFPR